MEKRLIEERRTSIRRAGASSDAAVITERRESIDRRIEMRPNGHWHTESAAASRRKKIYLERRKKERIIQEIRKEKRLRKELGLV